MSIYCGLDSIVKPKAKAMDIFWQKVTPSDAQVRSREAVAPARVSAGPRKVFYNTGSDSDSEYDDY